MTVATISDSYLTEQKKLHENPKYGVASLSFAPVVRSLLRLGKCESLSDYGLGVEVPTCERACVMPPAGLPQAQLDAMQATGSVAWCRTCVPISGQLALDDVRRIERAGNQRWLVVRGTLPDGPAAKAGILPNDLIVAINGKPLSFGDDVDLLDFFASIRAGDRVEATLLRGDEKRKVVLVAAAMTAEQQERWKQNYELAKKKRKRAES